MEELTTLTAGQQAVVDAYLANYEPAADFYEEGCILIDTQTMILEMDAMCDFEQNALCDYLAEKGYSAHFIVEDAIGGWILKKI